MKYEDLKILDELREKGSITEEEFQREKAKVLDEDNKRYSKMHKNPLFGMTQNNYLMLMHLSLFVSLFTLFVGLIIPIILWVINKENSAEVDRHGKNILNLILSFAIYGVALTITILGIPLLLVLLVILIVVIIKASVKASNGEYWEYPLTIKFFK
ncbi:MAG: DUF4870 domain-containing protein [Bacteroidales bacterium]|nr:DUF4870 domain-containing protein [Bacteroidales bacterium]